jgi:hypothetical protein
VRALVAYRVDRRSVGADGEVPCSAGHVRGEGGGGAPSRHGRAMPSSKESLAKPACAW